MKRASLFLSILMCVGLLMVPLGASASSDGTMADHTFSDRDYFNKDVVLEQGRRYTVPYQGILRIEKGATLYVDGDLKVLGTLKNYGTIVVRDVTKNADRLEEAAKNTAGNMSVEGELQNYGTIKIDSATAEVTYNGTLMNDGTITLLNDTKENATALRINSRRTEAAKQGGKLVNSKKGIINVSVTTGKGLVVGKDATFKNDGVYRDTTGNKK